MLLLGSELIPLRMDFPALIAGGSARRHEPVAPGVGSLAAVAPSGIASTTSIKPQQHFPGFAFAGFQESRTVRVMASCDPRELWRVHRGLKTVCVLKP